MDKPGFKPRILVVDDSLLNIGMVEAALRNEGFEIMVATSGEKTIRMAQLALLDLILLDVLMPGLDGFETCKHLKALESTKEIPVIFMTGLASIQDKIKGFEAGGVDYVTKPIEIQVILARIKTHLTLHDVRRELEAQNKRLLGEIIERKRAEAEVISLNTELERRVQERTADVLAANADLRQAIAERIQTEERLLQSRAELAMVLDGISDPLIMLDEELRVRRINKAAKDYYGLTSDDEAAGKFCYEVRGKSSPCEGCERPFSELRGYSGSYERKGALDPDKLEQVVVDLVRDESGEHKASIVRIEDITQAKMMERQLIQSEKLASLGLVVAGVAHEINNPNNFIHFNTPILRSYLHFLLPIVDEYASAHPELRAFGRPYPAFREDCFKLLDNIDHGSTRINQIVGNLREFVRERGKGERRWIDLKQVVEKGISICLGRIKRTVKTFEASIPEGLPALFTDPLAIEQVVVNLLINAAQAVDKDDSWVRLRITSQNEPRCDVVVEVSDNGCGMDAETRKRIFDPFFTTKAVGAGTGLGLSITHRLVEEMGGRIEVQSEVGNGSIFRVKLTTTSS